MKLIIACCGILSVITSFATGHVYLLFASTVLILIYLLLLIRENTLVSTKIFELLGKKTALDAHKVRGDDPARSLKAGLSALRMLGYRIDRMNWQMDLLRQERMASTDLSGNTISQFCSGNPADIPADEFLETFLKQLSQKLKCTASAVIFRPVSQPHLACTLVCSAVNGRKFKACLQHFYKSYYSRESAPESEIIDLAQPASLLGEFTVFGFRYIAALPLVWIEKEVKMRGVVWLGYAESEAPSSVEIQFALDFKTRFESELNDFYRKRDLISRARIAESQSKEKDGFIAHISHDIRSPLNNIRSILNLFKLESSPEDASELLSAALKNCDSMAEILEDLLDLSKHSAGKLIPSFSDISLIESVRETVGLYKASALEKGLELSLHYPRLDLHITADKKHLKRILGNLLSNAIKYTNFGSVNIRISLTRDERVAIAIKDTGPGLSQEEQNMLFKPFTRLHDDTTQGCGLGLALSKSLAELNQGEITVHSEKGKGAAFYLVFPLSYSAELSNNSSPVQHSHDVSYFPHASKEEQNIACNDIKISTDNVLKVLIVDDDIDCTETLARNLELSRFHVTKALSVLDAISISNFETPDVLITDADMPDGGGLRLLQALKQSGKKPFTSVVSGKESDELKDKYRLAGANEILLKPVNSDEILGFIAAYFSSNDTPELQAEGGGLHSQKSIAI